MRRIASVVVRARSSNGARFIFGGMVSHEELNKLVQDKTVPLRTVKESPSGNLVHVIIMEEIAGYGARSLYDSLRKQHSKLWRS